MVAPNKSLGQHWLKDRSVLGEIADCAELSSTDTVLEIGPGLGTLTSALLRAADKVVAVEFDADLAVKLPGQFPGTNLEVVSGDILSYDLAALPSGYKVVANVPYYITSKIVQKLMTADNKPSISVLLVQKEVAERLAAQPGDLSILGISAQVFADVSLGPVVPAEMFTPPPKVDSQVVVMKTLTTPRLGAIAETDFFRTIKLAFAAKRKKLRSSLAAGLHMSKPDTEKLLQSADINPELRAQDVSIEQWIKLTEVMGGK